MNSFHQFCIDVNGQAIVVSKELEKVTNIVLEDVLKTSQPTFSVSIITHGINIINVLKRYTMMKNENSFYCDAVNMR